MYELEKTLFQVNKYYGWRLTVGEDYFLLQEHHITTLQPEPAVSGIVLVISPSLQTFTKKFLELAGLALSHQHPDILRMILSLTFQTFREPVYSFVHSCILSYLTALARKIFVESHPVRRILNLTERKSQLERPELKVLTLMRHIASRHAGPTSDEVFRLADDMVVMLLAQTDCTSAYEFCQGVLCRCADTLGKKHWRYRQLKTRFARLLYVNDRCLEANNIWQELVGPVPRLEQGWQPSDASAVMAAASLGDACEERHDIEGAKIWYQRAASGCGQLFGSEDIATLLLLHKAKQMEAQCERRTTSKDAVLECPEKAESRQQDVESLVAQLEERLSQLDLEAADNSIVQGEPWDTDNVGAAIDTASTEAPELSFGLTLNTPEEGVGTIVRQTNSNVPLSWIATEHDVPFAELETHYPKPHPSCDPGPNDGPPKITSLFPSQQTFGDTPASTLSGFEQYCPPLPTLSNDAEMAGFDTNPGMHQEHLAYEQFDENHLCNWTQFVNRSQNFSMDEQQTTWNQQFGVDQQIDMSQQFAFQMNQPPNHYWEHAGQNQQHWIPQIDSFQSMMDFDQGSINNPVPETFNDADFVDWDQLQTQELVTGSGGPYTHQQRITEVQ
ncbi:hypothetical protein LTR10_018777 [Elasticomyces elasticus]|uniref:Transcription factor domain-containing protein n=1 Tax=Exophiala sideris TaxID=1016849 RepID=A0ABR0J8B4_9EURO|nr:hypothetical protein LTR10_018777 [Elasticomyces elasticus]KAK5029903.1 hypothetical protein LTS07_005627 [Exophiala sideris]KAK5031657.1 hypothetical protein LTR13_007647 [Exophiala sideris]KAK5058335.1 hypothetical protein LTR69_006740 [Exophiala sideris]KAK5180264.1 hypothetical protein LTR44_007390 [Eurotiomycetes sp. CCFEE 6388]